MAVYKYCWFHKHKHNYTNLSKPNYCKSPAQCESCKKFIEVTGRTEKLLLK